MSTTHERAKAAAEEIERKWKLTHHHYEGYVTPHETELAEIIARHFAEQDASDVIAKAREAANAGAFYSTRGSLVDITRLELALEDLGKALDRLDAARKDKP